MADIIKHKKNSGAAETHKWLLKQGISEEQIAESNRQLKAYRERRKNPNQPRWPPTFPLPDIYDNDDDELIGACIDATEGLYKDYIESWDRGMQYKAAVQRAYDIRAAWEEYKLILPEVPLAKDLDWPTKQDILKLHLWFRSTLVLVGAEIDKRFTKEQASQLPSGGKAGDTTQPTPETTKQKAKSVRDLVFIGYSHKDKRWLNDLQTHLKPYVRNGLTAWSDKQITPGSKWFPKIETALASTKVAVLLVTPNFLASDFIHEKELGPLLKEAENGKVSILWIPVRACAYKETPLKDYQAVIGPEKPLANMKAERDKAWVKICEEIKKAVSSSLS